MSFWQREKIRLMEMLLGPRRPRRRGMAETMLTQRAAAIRASDGSAPAVQPAGRAAPVPQPARSRPRADAQRTAPASTARPPEPRPAAAPGFWSEDQQIRDWNRNWQMESSRLSAYMETRERYSRERPSHPEWAPFDPAPSPPAGPPTGVARLAWDAQGQPDLSPLPARQQLQDLDENTQIPLAFPREDFVVGRGWVNGHHPVTVGPTWYRDNIVDIPNRWGIQDVRDKVDKDGKRIGVEYFTPKSFKCHRLVAPHLIAALDELDARGLLCLVKTMEGYNPRCVRRGTVRSRHSYGIAFDINHRDYPLIEGRRFARLKGEGRLPSQDERLIAILQKHGFFYGGDYENSSDAMHFEYADPRVLLPNR